MDQGELRTIRERRSAHCTTSVPVALSGSRFVLFYLAADWLDCPRGFPCEISQPCPKLDTEIRNVVVNWANHVKLVQS